MVSEVTRGLGQTTQGVTDGLGHTVGGVSPELGVTAVDTGRAVSGLLGGLGRGLEGRR